jgi:PadR family transcriptional regulator, regulatory protein PadR
MLITSEEFDDDTIKHESQPSSFIGVDEKLMEDREFYFGLIRLHILHHAAQEPIFGLGIIEELARHGYKLSAGTLYPMLHDMEQKGYLNSCKERSGRHIRRVYRATPLGKARLEEAKEKVRELFGELFEGE